MASPAGNAPAIAEVKHTVINNIAMAAPIVFLALAFMVCLLFKVSFTGKFLTGFEGNIAAPCKDCLLRKGKVVKIV
jgi:hypothetical protein